MSIRRKSRMEYLNSYIMLNSLCFLLYNECIKKINKKTIQTKTKHTHYSTYSYIQNRITYITGQNKMNTILLWWIFKEYYLIMRRRHLSDRFITWLDYQSLVDILRLIVVPVRCWYCAYVTTYVLYICIYLRKWLLFIIMYQWSYVIYEASRGAGA